MAQLSHIQISRYERFAGHVPVLPQVIVMVAMLAVMTWLSLMTGPAFLRFESMALAVMQDRYVNASGDFLGLVSTLGLSGALRFTFGTEFGYAAGNLGLHLAGIAGLAFLLPRLPMFAHKGLDVPEGRIARLLAWPVLAVGGLALYASLPALLIWVFAGGFILAMASFVALLLNPLAMIPAVIATGLVHLYALQMILQAIRRS